MSTPTVLDVAGYAGAVRHALAGLGAEQVEELTDGLEADLAEAMADRGGPDPVAVFGSPEEYAAELGAAAGLALPGPAGSGGHHHLPEWLRHPVRESARTLRAWLARLRATRWWAPVEDFLVALRPVWWVARGWVVFQLLDRLVDPDRAQWLPGSAGAAVACGVLVVASVQWGRGRWRLGGRWRRVVVVVSGAAAVAVLPYVTWLGAQSDDPVNWGTAAPQVVYQEQVADGVVVDGMQVSNLFVYDAEGNPVPNAQIVDDRGRPVRTTYDEGQAEWFLYGLDFPWAYVGAIDTYDQTRWNVYPLRGATSDQRVWDDATGRWGFPEGVEIETPPWPFAKAPAVVPDEVATGDEGEAPSSAPTTPAPATPSPEPIDPTPAPTAAS